MQLHELPQVTFGAAPPPEHDAVQAFWPHPTLAPVQEPAPEHWSEQTPPAQPRFAEVHAPLEQTIEHA